MLLAQVCQVVWDRTFSRFWASALRPPSEMSESFELFSFLERYEVICYPTGSKTVLGETVVHCSSLRAPLESVMTCYGPLSSLVSQWSLLRVRVSGRPGAGLKGTHPEINLPAPGPDGDSFSLRPGSRLVRPGHWAPGRGPGPPAAAGRGRLSANLKF